MIELEQQTSHLAERATSVSFNNMFAFQDSVNALVTYKLTLRVRGGALAVGGVGIIECFFSTIGLLHGLMEVDKLVPFSTGLGSLFFARRSGGNVIFYDIDGVNLLGDAPLHSVLDDVGGIVEKIRADIRPIGSAFTSFVFANPGTSLYLLVS